MYRRLLAVGSLVLVLVFALTAVASAQAGEIQETWRVYSQTGQFAAGLGNELFKLHEAEPGHASAASLDASEASADVTYVLPGEFSNSNLDAVVNLSGGFIFSGPYQHTSDELFGVVSRNPLAASAASVAVAQALDDNMGVANVEIVRAVPGGVLPASPDAVEWTIAPVTLFDGTHAGAIFRGRIFGDPSLQEVQAAYVFDSHNLYAGPYLQYTNLVLHFDQPLDGNAQVLAPILAALQQGQSLNNAGK